MSFETRAIATATRLIAKYGQKCIWRKPDGDEINVAVAWFRPTDVGSGALEFYRAMTGTEVPTGSEIGLMAGGQTFDPELTDLVYRNLNIQAPGGEATAITALDAIKPSGLPLLWFVSVST